jgi:hypothetical protein
MEVRKNRGILTPAILQRRENRTEGALEANLIARANPVSTFLKITFLAVVETTTFFAGRIWQDHFDYTSV